MDSYSKQIISMPVYSIQEGNFLGSVKSLLIDGAEKSLFGLSVERKRFNREERFIPYCHIKNIGEDVITVDKAAYAGRWRSAPQTIGQMKVPFVLIGARVFTAGGKILGKTEEYTFESESGKISSLQIGQGNWLKEAFSLKADYIITMANGVIMIDDDALDDFQSIGGGLSAAASSALNKANSVLNGALNISKRISRNISAAAQKLKADDYDAAEEDAVSGGTKAANSEEADAYTDDERECSLPVSDDDKRCHEPFEDLTPPENSSAKQ
jgi:uncharacterized protein YrrD